MDTSGDERPALEPGCMEEGRLGLGGEIRRAFPIFAASGDRAAAYLDSAASSQKPRCVISRLERYLSCEHANIHRGVYRLSAQATARYEEARRRAAYFINAPSPRGVVFTKGATESINLAAHAFEKHLQAGDVVLLTMLEHHSNIVPWQLMAERRGVRLAFADLRADASLDVDDFHAKLKTLRPKLAAMTHVSNAFGTVLPVEELCAAARAAGAAVLLDAAQSAAHRRLDVQRLGADFVAFSGHKIYGPTGIGVLYISPAVIDGLEPFQGGGDMIASVTTEGSTWAEPPAKFEAGTPPIGEAVALGAAIDFLDAADMARVAQYEHALFEHAFEALRREPGVRVYGPAAGGGAQESIVSFNLQGVHAADLAAAADGLGVQLRAGHHCAMPAMRRLGLEATARMSLGLYSTREDIAQLLEAVRYAKKLFA